MEELMNPVCFDETDYDEDMPDNKLTAYDIAVFYNTYNLSTLLKWWGTKLIVPSFQRSYVWNQRQASEFVDSILRGLPVPSLFFYDDNGKYLVVDGQQRLTSLHKFIAEKKFNGKTFKLIGNIHENWRNKSFDKLEQEDKDRLVDALLNATVMRQLQPDDGQSSMYLAFQRINTGGMSLKAQEIRMAVSFGPLAEFLDKISRSEFFDKWPFLRNDLQRKNGNYSSIQELILKFWTYFIKRESLIGSSSRSLLDDFFSEQKDFDMPRKRKPGVKYYSKSELSDLFQCVLDEISIFSVDDLSPFSKPAQSYLEAIWVGLANRKLILKKEINKDTLIEFTKEWKNAIGEQKFSELFQARRSSSMTSVNERITAAIDYFSKDF